MNVLFITLDQFRGDSLSCAGHPLVHTPNLDALADHGVRLARHYAQTNPCGPGRASLYTGTYLMNHRVVGNGTPLDARFDNLALVARRAGYEPALFGYTDTAVDPRTVASLDDPRLRTYEGVLPGFDPVLLLVEEHEPWRAWLETAGHDPGVDAHAALSTESTRPVELSLSSFTTDRVLEWIDRQDRPWLAHVSYLRPHPPYDAAGEFSQWYDPADVPAAITPADDRHRLHDRLLEHPQLRSPAGDGLRRLRAAYYGMISEVDHQLGRLWQHLRDTGAWDDTLIVVTADHGEQLGDHGYIQKAGFFEQSHHIVGVVRDPSRPAGHGRVVDAFTENVDLLPTVCEVLGIEVPLQCDGMPLTPYLDGVSPPWWRDAAHWEFDWRTMLIGSGPPPPWPWDRRLEQQHLAVRRDDATAFVQFGDGSSLTFDLAADPTWRTMVDERDDPTRVLDAARAMLRWRSTHADRTLAGTLIADGIQGRHPAVLPTA